MDPIPCPWPRPILPDPSTTCENSARSDSSSMSSCRFFTYRFMPWYLAMRSARSSSNLSKQVVV